MKNIVLILLCIVLLGLVSGCATVPVSNIGYEKFYDSYGDHKLVGRNNDIYLEKLDGSESRQITHTPNNKERLAWFTKSGDYIVYWDETTPSGYGAYLTNIKEDDSKRIHISEDEASKLMYEKIR